MAQTLEAHTNVARRAVFSAVLVLHSQAAEYQKYRDDQFLPMHVPMIVTTEDRKQMISRLLTRKPGCAADPRALAEQVLWLWEQVAFHLTPLIGVSGFQTLYARALHLAAPECPGFSAIQAGQSVDALFQALKKDLCALDPDVAEKCGNALLNTFTDLVESMIGEVLMAQILRSAWVGPSHGTS